MDVIIGGSGNDQIWGGGGSDYLNGRGGSDTLTGGTGADTFAFFEDTLGYVDTITDFRVGQGDKINISNLLFGYDPVNSAITDFFDLTRAGEDTFVWVDRDGSGASYSMQTIAMLDDVRNLNENTLLTNGNLIA